MTETPSIAFSTKLYLRLYRLIQPFHKKIYKGMVLAPIIGVLSIVPAYFTKLLFDYVSVGSDISLLTVLVCGIVAFSIVSILSEAALNYYTAYLNIKLENVVQLLFFDHLQNLPYRFFYERKIGEISSRFQEIKSALGSIHSFLRVVIGQGIYLVIAPIFLIYLNWQLALVAMISVPISSLAIYLVNNKLRHSWKNVVESHAEVEASQFQMLNQILTIKSLQLERRMYENSSLQYTRVLGAHLKAQGLTIALTVFDKIINALNLGLLTWLGWYFIVNGEMSLGDYVAFTAYVAYLRNPIMELIEFFTNFQQWAIHLNRIFDYFDVAPEQPLCSSADAPLSNKVRLNQALVLTRVNYHYPDNSKALDDISISISAGEAVAFIGMSGSGKSTLLRLLTRIESGYEGEVTIDGRSIEDIPLREYRSMFGIAWQDADLFHGSIRDNLTMGSTDVDTDWLNEVVRLCCLEEFIASLEAGYETPVAEKGTTLSAGQRQRVALARSLMRKPSVLVLDEAFSNLDLATEAKVIDNVFSHAKANNITVLFITHRLSTVQGCDKVYLMANGKVVDSGSYRYLEANSKPFRQLQKYEAIE